MNQNESWEQEQLRALYNLHKRDWWGEELLSNTLFGPIHKLLTSHERQILELAVDRQTPAQMGKLMNITPSSVKVRMYEIKKIFRTHGKKRVDDLVRKAIFEGKIKKAREVKR